MCGAWGHGGLVGELAVLLTLSMYVTHGRTETGALVACVRVYF